MTIRPARYAVIGFLAILVSLAAGAPARAIIAISNLENLKSSDYIVDASQSIGAMFTTGSGLWQITTVGLYAGNFDTSPNGNFSVSLYSVSGSLPNQKIVDFTGSNPTAYNTYTYTPASVTTLQPSTSYYIVASSTSDNSSFYVWAATSETTVTAAPGWTLFSGNATAAPAWGLNSGTDTPQFEVNATAVPEPGMLALLGLGGLALGATRLRKRA